MLAAQEVMRERERNKEKKGKEKRKEKRKKEKKRKKNIVPIIIKLNYQNSSMLTYILLIMLS